MQSTIKNLQSETENNGVGLDENIDEGGGYSEDLNKQIELVKLPNKNKINYVELHRFSHLMK